MDRRYFLLVLCITTLFSGCSANREDSYLLAQEGSSYLNLLKNNELTKEQANHLPYATLQVAINDAHKILMPLGYLEAGQQQWFSKDLFSFTTKNGRIIQMYNTDEEISEIRRIDFYKGVYLHTIKPKQTFNFIVEMDFLTQKRFGVKAFLTVKVKGVEERELWGEPILLLKIEERVLIPSMNFEFTNFYWRDLKTHFIWESVQKWGPNALKIHYKVLKPWVEVKNQ